MLASFAANLAVGRPLARWCRTARTGSRPHAGALLPTALRRRSGIIASVQSKPVAFAVRTVCHECCGEGAIAYSRAAVGLDGDETRGYDVYSCPRCNGHEWLPGMAAPA